MVVCKIDRLYFFLVPECIIWIITCTMLHYVVRQKGTWMKILTKWYKFLLFFYFFYGFAFYGFSVRLAHLWNNNTHVCITEQSTRWPWYQNTSLKTISYSLRNFCCIVIIFSFSVKSGIKLKWNLHILFVYLVTSMFFL